MLIAVLLIVALLAATVALAAVIVRRQPKAGRRSVVRQPKAGRKSSRKASAKPKAAPVFTGGFSESATQRALNGSSEAADLLTAFGQRRVELGRKLGITTEADLRSAFKGCADIGELQARALKLRVLRATPEPKAPKATPKPKASTAKAAAAQKPKASARTRNERGQFTK